MEFIIFIALLAIGFFAGSYAEQKHYLEIKQRERKSLHVPLMNFGAKQELPYAHEAQMFVGSVVIANDYFKTFAATLHNLVGGRVVVYESLLDRGRREAVLRMKEEAIAWGASQVVNVRFETSNIGGQETTRTPAMVEVIVYGTGIR
ncbi:heavy metal-binding domain-containing protein [Romeria aff. gracilis LEGE 07310]|uniref:Heavy metal-binding domain-containing protein n=1 Tax=Vasconcelosia minhoensis LEGE 07310 TaxID=915328 RepID=A0A8J7DBA5_9CYAN|nr:heavy metal-binding domain-containing protein [Romeria gracilis]MBE9076118.1 heavy metal-binding domain-containing protein [Romeria aff. gracilis LEGE 07310]